MLTPEEKRDAIADRESDVELYNHNAEVLVEMEPGVIPLYGIGYEIRIDVNTNGTCCFDLAAHSQPAEFAAYLLAMLGVRL